MLEVKVSERNPDTRTMFTMFQKALSHARMHGGGYKSYFLTMDEVAYHLKNALREANIQRKWTMWNDLYHLWKQVPDDVKENYKPL